MREILLSLLLCALGVAFAEFKEWMPWLARRIVSSAVMALEEKERQRMREELLAEVAAVPGKISPLLFAVHLWWGFWRGSLAASLSEAACRVTVRCYDVVFAFVAYFFASPLVISVAVINRLIGGGPVFVSRMAVGVDGKNFRLTTFRTRDMLTGKRGAFGTFIEKTGLSTLPLYVAVLQGNLSLVGPVPLSPRQAVGRLTDKKPGLLWFTTFGVEVPTQFGKKAWPTLCGYVQLIWLAIRHRLFTAPE